MYMSLSGQQETEPCLKYVCKVVITSLVICTHIFDPTGARLTKNKLRIHQHHHSNTSGMKTSKRRSRHEGVHAYLGTYFRSSYSILTNSAHPECQPCMLLLPVISMSALLMFLIHKNLSFSYLREAYICIFRT